MRDAKVDIVAVDKFSKNISKFNKSLSASEKRAKSLSAGMSKLQGVIAAAFTGAAINKIASLTAEYQKLEASLETVTGSSLAASKAFMAIKEFATSTPFSIQEITKAFVKLKALGLDPSKEAMLSYGNTASAMGLSLNQMIEAVADAATGEFERLKEFGIKAKKQGDEVSLTFQGVTTTIRNNARDIEGYLRDIGNNQFAGAMERQMNTLGGAFSNLSDAASTAAVAFSESSGLAGALKDSANWLAKFLNEAQDGPAKIAGLVADIERLETRLPGAGARNRGALEARLKERRGDLLKAISVIESEVGLRTKINLLEAQLAGIESGGRSGRNRPRTMIANLNAEIKQAYADLAALELDMSDIVSEPKPAAKADTQAAKAEKILQTEAQRVLNIQLDQELAQQRISDEILAGVRLSERATQELDRQAALKMNAIAQQEKANRAIEDAQRRQQQFADTVAATMTSSLEEVLLEAGKLKDVFNALLKDLARIIVRRAILQPLAAGISSAIPQFAGGTTYAPGGAAIVGERGPELVNLPRGSRVHPDLKGVGGGGDMVVNIVNNSNAKIETEERQSGNTRVLEVMLTNIIASDINNGGAIAKSMAGTFGSRRRAVVR